MMKQILTKSSIQLNFPNYSVRQPFNLMCKRTLIHNNQGCFKQSFKAYKVEFRMMKLKKKLSMMKMANQCIYSYLMLFLQRQNIQGVTKSLTKFLMKPYLIWKTMMISLITSLRINLSLKFANTFNKAIASMVISVSTFIRKAKRINLFQGMKNVPFVQKKFQQKVDSSEFWMGAIILSALIVSEDGGQHMIKGQQSNIIEHVQFAEEQATS